MKTIIKTALLLISAALMFQNAFSDEFRFDYDYCVFRSDNQKLFLEFYYAFSQQKLLFVKTENGYEAAGELDLEVFDKNRSKTIIRKMFKVPVTVPDTIDYDRGSNLTGQVNFLLDSGEYVFRIKACDFNNPSDSSSFDDNLDLNRFPQGSVTLSCIELSTNIHGSEDKNSVFYKNTLEIVPNPNRLFGNNLSVLHYYFEIYNLKKENISEDYFIVSDITDLNNNKLKSQEKKYRLKNEAKVEYGSFDLSDLPTNSYNLVIRVVDDKNKEAAKNIKKFFVYNSDTSKISLDKYKDDYLLSEYANYSEDHLDGEFKQTLYISTDVEKEQYQDLKNIDAKRKFMYEFWKRRDITPLTPVNEFKSEYFERIKYANSHFKFDFTEGWRTDRGRVYVLYGKPDETDRYPFESDKRAYEIWKYNAVEGGVEFVFVDLGNATGNYGLVHSTARNELRNDNWETKLRIR
jgi:GWxTD domain-containing protein